MSGNYKKGFSLAEMMIIFLALSVMITAFVPIMTKKPPKKAVEESCRTGTTAKMIEYIYPGNYNFTAPDNVVGNATVVLVGGGGRGSDATIVIFENQVTSYTTGGGGGGGEYVVKNIELIPGKTYEIVVGAGAKRGDNAGGSSSFGESGKTDVISALGGNSASGMTGGAGGAMPVYDGGSERYSGQSGAGGYYCPGGPCAKGAVGPEEGKGGQGGENGNSQNTANVGGGKGGDLCLNASSSSCNFNGRQGSGYEQNGMAIEGFVAGAGGGGGSIHIDRKASGAGGIGGGGYARIEYKVRCGMN